MPSGLVISQNPVTIQLRYLQTLIEVSGNESSTIVFPIDVLGPLAAAGDRRSDAAVDRIERARLDEALAGALQALEAATTHTKLTERAKD